MSVSVRVYVLILGVQERKMECAFPCQKIGDEEWEEEERAELR